MPGVLTQRNLSFDLALEAATVALETASSRGYHVGVALTNRTGRLLVLLRHDGGGAHLLYGAGREPIPHREAVLPRAPGRATAPRLPPAREPRGPPCLTQLAHAQRR